MFKRKSKRIDVKLDRYQPTMIYHSENPYIEILNKDMKKLRKKKRK